MGRPPIGKVAMTATERVHKFRAKQHAAKGESAAIGMAEIVALKRQLAQARDRITELERRGVGQLTRGRERADGARPVEFTEVGRLRAEIAKLKFDVAKLKAALEEEPDAAKLRKKVVDQRTEMAALRQELRRVAKERDHHQRLAA